jgi:hypothetical protein
VELSDTWFPTGRNPWRDLYTPERIESLANGLGLKDDRLIFSLERQLCQVAEKYLVVMGETVLFSQKSPSGITYRNKATWLRKRVVRPAVAVLKALGAENRGWLSLFPFEQASLPPLPAFIYLEAELSALQKWAESFAAYLENVPLQAGKRERLRPALHPVVDLKYALVMDLTRIYAKLPDRDGKGGKRNPAIASIEINNKQEIKGEFINFVRNAAHPIIGRRENLTDQAKSAVRKLKSTK